MLDAFAEIVDRFGRAVADPSLMPVGDLVIANAAACGPAWTVPVDSQGRWDPQRVNTDSCQLVAGSQCHRARAGSLWCAMPDEPRHGGDRLR